MKQSFRFLSFCLAIMLTFGNLSYADFSSVNATIAPNVNLIVDGVQAENAGIMISNGKSYLPADALNKMLAVDSKAVRVAYNGKEYLPIRMVAEQAGYTVAWNDETRTILLKKAQMSNGELKIGDVISGFVVKSVVEMPAMQGKGITFEHEKSGATLFYMQNDAENKAFDISFKTPALNDKGWPHVLEHTLVSGSQKYPDPNMFMSVYSGSYSTYVNAFTAPNHTSYPLSSLSEKQLLTLVDYYMAGVFEPLLATEPKMFDREAWRYELSSADQPITITGTVYNEMKANINIVTESQLNTKKASFEGGKLNHDEGGLPSTIPEMTYQEVLDFHEKYYQPSNALIQLYGNLDYKKFLKLFDEDYLSKYDRKEVVIEDGSVEAYTETKYVDFKFPAPAGSPEMSAIGYNFVFDKASAEDTVILQLLATLFNSDSTFFKNGIREKFPQVEFYVDVRLRSPKPTLSFYGIGIDPSQKEEYVKTIDALLAQLVDKGFQKEVMETFWANQKLDNALLFTDGSFGNNTMNDNSNYWAGFGEPNYLAIKTKAYEGLDLAKLQAIAKTYFVDNKYRSVSTTTTVPGLVEENEAALAKKLADYKASLGDEGVKALVEKTAEQQAWATKAVSAEILGKILTIKPSDLKVEAPKYKIDEKDVDGIKYITSDVGVNELTNTNILLDLKDIPIEKLHDVQLYIDLLGKMSTSTMSKAEVATNNAKYGSKAKLVASYTSAGDPKNDQYRLSISWISLSENFADTVKFYKEVVNNSTFEDMSIIQNHISNVIIGTPQQLNSAPETTQDILADAVYNDVSAVRNYVTTDAYYNYLKEINALTESDPAAVTKRLAEAQAIVSNKQNAVVLFVGGSENMKTFENEIPSFFADMKAEARKAVDYSSLRLTMKGEGIVNEADVHTNYQYLGGLVNGEINGSAPVTAKLIADMYLVPELRGARGAYNAWVITNPNGIKVASYRDPSIKDTYEFFKGIPEFLRKGEFDQTAVDTYIVSAFPAKSMWKHPFVTYPIRQFNHLQGRDSEVLTKELEEMTKTTVEDIKAYADVYGKLVNEGIKTSGGRKGVLEESGQFDAYLEYK